MNNKIGEVSDLDFKKQKISIDFQINIFTLDNISGIIT